MRHAYRWVLGAVVIGLIALNAGPARAAPSPKVPDHVIPHQPDPAEGVTASGILQEVLDALLYLEGDTADPQMSHTLEAVIHQIEARQLDVAHDTLVRVVVPHLDGCDTGSVPDADDWLTTCTVQVPIKTLVEKAIDILDIAP